MLKCIAARHAQAKFPRPHAAPPPVHAAPAAARRGRPPTRRAQAAQSEGLGGDPEGGLPPTGGEVYEGMYGPWRVEASDVTEVNAYRAGINLTAAALAVAAAPALLPPPLAAPALPLLTPAAGVAAAALGVSLFLIHIYVTPIKRTLQALWLLGVAGGTYLAAAHQETPLPLWVAQHPEGVWFVGPAFAALTGVAIKEGICYGKAEAAVLAAAVPTLLLSHLAGAARWGGSGSGAADGWGAAAELALLAVALAAGGVFAGRKWSQALRDDIGDKSVFMFQALPEEEQAAVVARLRRERGGR